MEIKIAAKIAPNQVLISKPRKKDAANFKIMAFTTKVKKPSVKIFIGKVKIIRIGFTKIFKIPIIIEAIRADLKPEILTPGTK